AIGAPPTRYPRQFSRAACSSAMANNLSLSNAQPANGGSYSVVVTNAAGSVTSSVAVLTIWVPPAISGQPLSQTNVVGTTAGFSVAATGTPAPGYQWQFNGVAIANATDSALSITNVQTTRSDEYTSVLQTSDNPVS